MIALRTIAELNLSAASGLVMNGPHACVVADDEHFLDVYYALGTQAQGHHRVRLCDGELPEEHGARKQEKPDLESLLVLPDGRLLALGSGSTRSRDRGFILEVGQGIEAPHHSPREIRLTPLYEKLRETLPALNLEGACVTGDVVVLLHRGMGGECSAVAELDLALVMSALDDADCLDPAALLKVYPVDLGTLDGVPLGFTDGAPFPGRSDLIAFVAAAEDTANPYDDGACRGSVVGLLARGRGVIWKERVEGTHKLEGIAVLADRSALVVADPDDRDRRACLYELCAVLPCPGPQSQ